MRKLLLVFMIFSLSIVFVLPNAFAQNANNRRRPNPFSQCGIGAALFPRSHVGAVISNVIWDLGTTAVTSALSSPGTCNGQRVNAAVFVYKNYNRLAEQTARGNGEHLNTLMSILNVNETKRDKIVGQVRDDMAHEVSGADYLKAGRLEKAKFYYNSVIKALPEKAS